MPMPILTRSLRRLLPVLLLTSAPAALAQYPAGAVVQPLSRPDDPAELLAQALRTLAVEPSNLAALTAAGRNALVLGDPNAAVGFFGRAQEIAPRDGLVKAGLGSALVELEKPQDALRLFAEASRLGVPDTDLAADRGLAYDLTGDPHRAQHDYAAVLAAHPDDDLVRRRLALSQGISGDKTAAIATLDPLIRKRDIAGWRAQTFVLAMNGDAKGAGDITRIMLPQQAAMLQPFLVRLATLSPGDKARAVNFGEMPAAGRAYTPGELANTGGTPTYAASSRVVNPAPGPMRPAMPAPQVATRASDLAPIPAPTTTRIVTPVPVPRRVAPASTPAATAGASAPGAAGPLAGIALAPAPVVATQAATQAATQIASTPASPLRPVAIAQAGSPPSVASGFPASDLPTPAAVGHYDLPHDAVTRRPSVAPVVPAAAATQTIGTPVVHGRIARPGSPKSATAKLALADEPPAGQPIAARKPTRDEASDAPAPAASRSRHVLAPTDDTDTPGGTHRTAHGKPAATDDATDAGSEPATDRHGHKATRDKTTDADAPGDRSAEKTRRGAHGKSADADVPDERSSERTHKGAHGRSDDADTGPRTREGAHSGRLAAGDDGDDDGSRSRRTTHGKPPSDDEGGSRSSGSARKGVDKSETGRVFVQVAGGANKDDMDKAWASVKKKAPDLMKGRTPQTAPVHATNRLLVGPFKSEDEAQAFVNKMAGKGLSGFTVKTGKHDKVEKVDGGQ